MSGTLFMEGWVHACVHIVSRTIYGETNTYKWMYQSHDPHMEEYAYMYVCIYTYTPISFASYWEIWTYIYICIYAYAYSICLNQDKKCWYKWKSMNDNKLVFGQKLYSPCACSYGVVRYIILLMNEINSLRVTMWCLDFIWDMWWM